MTAVLLAFAAGCCTALHVVATSHPAQDLALDLALLHAQRPAGQTASGRPERKRRAASYVGAEPSVEEVEAEFWRIVETPDDVYESLYGQVSSGHILHAFMRLIL